MISTRHRRAIPAPRSMRPVGTTMVLPAPAQQVMTADTSGTDPGATNDSNMATGLPPAAEEQMLRGAPAYNKGGRQVIREPAAIVPLRGLPPSVRILATLDENGSKDPETVSIRNPGRKLALPKSMRMRSVRHYDEGGDLNEYTGHQGGTQDLTYKNVDGNSQTSGNAGPSTSTPTPSPPQPPPQPPYQLQGPSIAPPSPTSTQTAIYNAQQGQLSATAARIGAQQGQLAAQGGQLQAESLADQATRALLAEQSRAAAAQLADEQRQQAANNDVAGNTAAGRMQDQRNNDAPLYRLAGLAQPTVINTPNGEQPANLPPGVVAKIQTPGDVVTTQNQMNAAVRANETEQARVTEGNARLDATAAGRAVTAAGLGVTAAGIQGEQATLAEDQAKLAPAGMVYNPDSGMFMTPQDMRVYQAENSVVYDKVSKAFVTQADLLSRTDSYGNVLNTTTNQWQDPATGNILVNGTWTDKNGGTYDATANQWHYADGTTYIPPSGGHAGFRINPQGYIEGANGVWTHPVTGDRLIPDYDPNDPEVIAAIAGGAKVTPQGLLIQAHGHTVIGGAPQFGAPAGGPPAAPPPGKSSQPSLAETPMAQIPAAAPAVTAITSVFPPEQQANALKIVMGDGVHNGESGGDPTRISPANKDGSRDYGLFAINSGNFAKLTQQLGTTVNAQTILDPMLNARAALVILGWGKGRWQANWTTAKALGVP